MQRLRRSEYFPAAAARRASDEEATVVGLPNGRLRVERLPIDWRRGSELIADDEVSSGIGCGAVVVVDDSARIDGRWIPEDG